MSRGLGDVYKRQFPFWEGWKSKEHLGQALAGSSDKHNMTLLPWEDGGSALVVYVCRGWSGWGGGGEGAGAGAGGDGKRRGKSEEGPWRWEIRIWKDEGSCWVKCRQSVNQSCGGCHRVVEVR